MGIYYEYAVVHGRILLWWCDNNGLHHTKWVDGAAGEKLYGALNKLDMAIQRELAIAAGVED
jgi:hypothetical protein